MSELSYDTIYECLNLYLELALSMQFCKKSKFGLQFPSKNFVLFKYAIDQTICRQFGATANRDWIDLEAVCKTGQIPKTFNFARDVFEKHVVSLAKRKSGLLKNEINFIPFR